jgi:hypothetical protein
MLFSRFENAMCSPVCKNKGERSMLQSLLMFLAPQGRAVAAPPAQARSGGGSGPVRLADWKRKMKMALHVAGNTLGVCGLMLGAWYSLRLLELLLAL